MVPVSNKFDKYCASIPFLGTVVIVIPGSTTHTKKYYTAQ